MLGLTIVTPVIVSQSWLIVSEKMAEDKKTVLIGGKDYAPEGIQS